MYFAKVLTRMFGNLCNGVICPLNCGDVPGPGGEGLVDFVSLANNPVLAGMSRIHFGLAHDDRVEIDVYDVAGRAVRRLADRRFKAGDHDLVWDGADNSGRRLSRGVYFTRVKYHDGGFTDAKKITFLK